MRFLLGAFLSSFLVGALVALPGAAWPHWQARYGVLGEVGLFYAALLPGLLLGIRLAYGRPHPLYGLALLGLGLGLWGLALAPSYPVVVGLAFLLGVGEGAANLFATRLAGTLYPGQQVEVVNRVHAGFGLGAVLTPLGLTLLPYGVALGLLGALALGAALLVRQAPGGPTPRLALTPSPRPLLLLVLLYTGLEGALALWNRVWLATLGYPEGLHSLLLALFWLFLSGSRFFLAPWVAQNPYRALRGLLLGGLGILLLNLEARTAPLFPLVGLFLGPFLATLLAWAQSRLGPWALGPLFYVGALGGTLIPGLLGLVPPWVWPWSFIGLGLALLFLLPQGLRPEAKGAQGPPL